MAHRHQDSEMIISAVRRYVGSKKSSARDREEEGSYPVENIQEGFPDKVILFSAEKMTKMAKILPTGESVEEYKNRCERARFMQGRLRSSVWLHMNGRDENEWPVCEGFTANACKVGLHATCDGANRDSGAGVGMIRSVLRKMTIMIT